MAFLALATGTIVALAVIARLWWLVRDRSSRRREQAWQRWWAGYRLRLPSILMARWSRGRLLSHHRDPTP